MMSEKQLLIPRTFCAAPFDPREQLGSTPGVVCRTPAFQPGGDAFLTEKCPRRRFIFSVLFVVCVLIDPLAEARIKFERLWRSAAQKLSPVTPIGAIQHRGLVSTPCLLLFASSD